MGHNHPTILETTSFEHKLPRPPGINICRADEYEYIIAQRDSRTNNELRLCAVLTTFIQISRTRDYINNPSFTPIIAIFKTRPEKKAAKNSKGCIEIGKFNLIAKDIKKKLKTKEAFHANVTGRYDSDVMEPFCEMEHSSRKRCSFRNIRSACQATVTRSPPLRRSVHGPSINSDLMLVRGY